MRKHLKRKVEFGKKCQFCEEEPTVGVIDLSEKGRSAGLCNDHLIKFCESVIEENIES